MYEELPPPYDVHFSDETTSPSKFVIGKSSTTESLVSVSEIKGHLALLHSFAELKKIVESMDVDIAYVPHDQARKWTWFIGLAVERFDVWCKAIGEDDQRLPSHVVIPPIDVVMVWHTYMLNPGWYTEDCMRLPVCKRLKTMEPHFRQLLLDPSLMLSEPPTKSRIDHWQFNTQLGFDILKEVSKMIKKIISCPMCSKSIEVDYMNQEGKGYLQQKFATSCKNDGCTLGEITKEKLALGKLARDIATKISGSPEDHLPGTLFSSLNTDKGNKIKNLVCEAAKSANQNLLEAKYAHGSPSYYHELYLAIIKLCKYSLDLLRRRMGFSYQPLLVGRIISAYSDDKIYSVELVGAVLRQGSFVSKMHDLGWTRSGFFDGSSNELALHHALTRYHAFLDLISSSPTKFFVPTLDIDLVWHTRQLNSEKYVSDCMQYLNQFVDHDDKVEGIRLSSASDITHRAWKDRFGVRYSHCGCPVPGSTIGQRLSHTITHKSQAAAQTSHLVPMNRQDTLLATHPSDHNSVHFVAHTEHLHKVKTQKYNHLIEKKQKEKQESVKKAAIGRIFDNNKDDQNKVHASTCPYDPAFLFPIPLQFGNSVPVADGCVTSDGSIVSNIAGCGSGCGTGGCGGGVGGGDTGAGQSSFTYQLYPKMM